MFQYLVLQSKMFGWRIKTASPEQSPHSVHARIFNFTYDRKKNPDFTEDWAQAMWCMSRTFWAQGLLLLTGNAHLKFPNNWIQSTASGLAEDCCAWILTMVWVSQHEIIDNNTVLCGRKSQVWRAEFILAVVTLCASSFHRWYKWVTVTTFVWSYKGRTTVVWHNHSWRELDMWQ